MNTKEIAKFAAGFAADQLLTHGALAAADIEFALLGIAYTRELNMMAVLFWGILMLLLVYFAWFKRDETCAS